jgi:hypothetical protein
VKTVSPIASLVTDQSVAASDLLVAMLVHDLIAKHKTDGIQIDVRRLRRRSEECSRSATSPPALLIGQAFVYANSRRALKRATSTTAHILTTAHIYIKVLKRAHPLV